MGNVHLPLQNGCKRPAGTCLANQLTDLATADKARVAAGSTPLYFVGRYGGGTANAKQVCSISRSLTGMCCSSDCALQHAPLTCLPQAAQATAGAQVLRSVAFIAVQKRSDADCLPSLEL